MGSWKSLVLAGAAAFAGVPGFGADLGPLMQRPQVMAPAEDFGGWYLRGDVGVGVFHNPKWFDADSAAVGGSFVHQGNADAPFVGFGVGYQFNNWLRVDVTG